MKKIKVIEMECNGWSPTQGAFLQTVNWIKDYKS